MIRSRIFIVLAITLFLAGCLCAEAAAAADRNTAVQDVKTLQDLTKQVLSRAESNSREVESTKSTVELQRTKAMNAESDAKKAAKTITATVRKTQADVVAKKATEELVNCDALYDTAKAKAEEASKSLEGFVASAKKLVQSAQIDIPAASNPPEDYTNVIQNAATLTGQTTKLNQDIGKSADLTTAKIALSSLREGAKKVQVLKYQAESLVIVSNIEAKIKTSETDIQSIQQKKDEIDAIVNEMNQNLQSASGTSTSVLSSLCSTAESQLRTATNKVREANKCKEGIVNRKTILEQDLKTLMDKTDEETDAGQDAGRVVWHENFIEGEIEKIKAALGTAETSLRNAKNVQQQMRGTISQTNSQSGTKGNEGKPQDNARTADVTNPIQNGEAKNPEITETDQTVLEKSEDTIDKTSAQPVNTQLDSTEQTKSTQLTDKQKQNPKDDKSELLNNDKLRNISKDITNNPLIGGEVAKRSVANDSAVTVFIPLLAILVISAVLH